MRDNLHRALKRFYTEAGSRPAEGGGFALVLDGRAMLTPARRPFVVASQALAEALAAEWQAQGETIERQRMPLTRLVLTAIDRVAENPAALGDDLANFVRTDLVCFRGVEPTELVRRQAAGWDPLIDWAAERFGARLAVSAGIAAIDQAEDAVAMLGRHIETLPLLQLTALHAAAQATGSLVIALAFAEGRIDAAEGLALSQIDEAFQGECWGHDAEAVARRQSLGRELKACATVFALGA